MPKNNTLPAVRFRYHITAVSSGPDSAVLCFLINSMRGQDCQYYENGSKKTPTSSSLCPFKIYEYGPLWPVPWLIVGWRLRRCGLRVTGAKSLFNLRVFAGGLLFRQLFLISLCFLVPAGSGPPSIFLGSGHLYDLWFNLNIQGNKNAVRASSLLLLEKSQSLFFFLQNHNIHAYPSATAYRKNDSFGEVFRVLTARCFRVSTSRTRGHGIKFSRQKG